MTIRSHVALMSIDASHHLPHPPRVNTNNALLPGNKPLAMGLVSLHISNFKSYRGSLEIPFDTNPFVAVVGPNGSGKSNLLDALCFVIGMDARELRCKRLTDLVSKNSDGDMYVATKLIDSHDSPVELKRTPEAFYINDEEADAETYREKWNALNVLPGGKNAVVLQGDIERLAGAESHDLAKLVEAIAESSGTSVPFDFEHYNETEQQLNASIAETRKLTQSGRAALAEADETMKLDEAKAKLEDLKLQLRKSEKRKEGLVQREQIALLNGIRKEIREANQHLESCLEERRLAESDSKKLRTEFARKRKLLQNARNLESEAKSAVSQSEAHLEPVRKRLETLESELRLLGPELEFGEQAVQAADAEIQSAKDSIRLLQREFKRDKSRDSEAIEQQHDISPELRQMWTDLDTEFIGETALRQDEVQSFKRAAEKLEQQLRSEQRTEEDMQSEINALNTRLKNSQQRVHQLSSLISERSSQQDSRREELDKVASDLVSSTEEAREIKQKLRELEVKIKAADGNKQAVAQRHRLLTAVERLQRAHPGVHDILGNVVEAVEPEFQIALEKGIGGFHMDTIIVDTPETAFACIDQAKKDRLGRLHFMALSNLKRRDLAAARALISRQVSEGYDVRLLIDCAKFEARYRPAILQVLGDSAYVSSYDDGRKLRRNGLKMKLVTNTGSVISTSNIVSTSAASALSGKNSHRNLALMQRNEINLTEKLKLCQSRELELTDAEVRLNDQISRASLTISAAQDELEIAEEQLDSVNRSVDHHKRLMADLETKIEATKEKVDDAQADLDGRLEEIKELRREKFSDFIDEAGGSIEKWDELFASSAQRLYELRRQGQRLNDRLQMATEKRSAALSQINKQKERHAVLEGSLEQVNSQIEHLEADLAANSTKLNQARSRLATARSEAEAKSDEVGMAESALDNARARVAEAERDANRHKISLASHKEENPNDNEQNNSEEDYEDEDIEELSELSDMDDESGDESNEKTSSVPRKRKRNTARDTTKLDRQTLSIDRLETRISKLKTNIEVLARLVGVHTEEDDENDGATEKSLRASQAYEELDKTMAEVRAKQDQLSKQFESMRKERATRFMRVFQVLQLSLSSVYSELVGADAQTRLTVIDSEKPFEGIEFSVMPPGKPYTPVAQLSGGERSMAALALLFASQKLRPAPFIILDEVDAALDFANVSNLSRYLVAHCRETQYIAVSLHQRLFQTASHLVGVYKPKTHTEIVTIPV